MNQPLSFPRLASLFFFLIITGSFAQAQIALREVFEDPEVDWEKAQDRMQAVNRIKEIEDRDLLKAVAKAKQEGKPLREELLGGKVRILAGVDDDGELLYYETKNANAAVSTAANKLYTAPFTVDGSGVRVGVWEIDTPRDTHVEFNDGPISRINVIDNASYGNHATHVAGTIGAFGVNTNARGMAYQTTIDSYTASNDRSEMTAAGATAPNQFTTKLYVSNHSYGFTYGWRSTDAGLFWTGTGTDQNAYDPDFGQYSSTSANIDNIHYNTPYYLAFWAAGNENNEGPRNNQSVTIGGISVNYNPAIHPQNDGDYSNDFDTLGDQTTAKNVMVIGAVTDAVMGGQRDPSVSIKAGFSSTGPCDDGRIKPDVVGNGTSVFSTLAPNDTSYGNLSGTSMSTPNVCGTAALLVDLYRDLFSGGAMRGSTLRALLIHTATDMGNPGPDYKYGWGLVDAEKAAEHIKRQANSPGLESVLENELSTAEPNQAYSFAWDGASSIRATICWTDPAGASESTHNERTPDLVNDLNIKLIAPDGTEHFPFVMPFVGTWTIASMDQNATRGVNHVDNVEQVLVESPGQAGVWQVQVTHVGNLTNNVQEYGLLISGADATGILSFSNASYTVDEDAGVATITVNREGGTIGAVSADYATSDGTAIAGSDYVATSGTLNWAVGEGGAKSFNVPIVDNGISEVYEEALLLTLSNHVGISLIGSNPATLTIVDDEALIGVTAPNSEENIYTNTDYNITWTSSLGGNVRIELLKNGTSYLTIVNSTANDGSYLWSVLPYIPTDSDYRIRITSLAAAGEQDDSNADISIENVLYVADMETDPGWILQGGWAYGTPTGGGGSTGLADPLSGYTGSNVIGYNLNGDYTNGLGETFATTPVIDCTAYTNIKLSLRRWLNVEDARYDNAAIRVSNDGSNWTNVWAHTGTSNLTASIWSEWTYDISAVADGQSTVYVRWVMGTTDGSITYSGWNIDDVVISGDTAGSTLAVTPANAFDVSGNLGGPFSPSSKQYTLTNNGSESIDWTAVKTAAWLDLSATSGTLAAGANTTVTVSVNSDANALAADTYNDTVLFTNTTTGLGSSGQDVSLTVIPLGTLVVNPAGDLSVSGEYSGPFSPASQAYTLTNSGSTSINWTASKTMPWVTLSSSSGTLAPSASTTVTASINAGANTLEAIAHGDTISFNNTTNGNGNSTRNVSLAISQTAQTINFATLSPVGTDQTPYTLTASTTSGLAITYTSSDTSVATVSGNTLNLLGSGTTTITASQAGDTNYAAATPVQQQLTVFQTNLAQALVYEPFDDTNTSLNANASGEGLSGNWTGSGAISASSLSFAGLPASSGGSVTLNNQNGYVSTDLTLGATGLLNDGTSLWFSVIVKTGNDIGSNGDLGLCLGTDQINTGNNLGIVNSGQSLGFTIKQGQLRASHWAPALARSSTNSGNAVSAETLYLVVGKFTWGTSSDTIEIYRPSTNLILGPAVSTYTTPSNVDQSLFDTIAFSSKLSNTAPHILDEIRFGASYESVIGLGSEPVDHFAISSIASPQTAGQAITGVTITAQTTSNETADSFTGTVTFGGTAGITGTSASFVDGVLSGVSLTPIVTGDNLTFTVDDGESHTGSAIFNVQGAYENWSGALAAADMDANNDGVSNGIAWVLGATDPSSDAVAMLPTMDNTTDTNHFIYTYRRHDDAHGDSSTTIATQYSSDLNDWTTAVHNGTDIIISESDDFYGTGIDKVEVKIKRTLATGGKLFSRLRVAITP